MNFTFGKEDVLIMKPKISQKIQFLKQKNNRCFLQDVAIEKTLREVHVLAKTEKKVYKFI